MFIESRLKSFPSRIKAIRTILLGINRDEFAKRFNIPRPTIARWEDNSSNVAITPVSMSKLIDALATEANIIITEEWLINGRGVSPFDSITAHTEELKEESIFLLANPKAILFEIPDSSYEPFCFKGDLIGALLVETNRLLQKSIVLIEDKTAKREIRKVLMGSEGLICFLPVGISNSSEVLAYKPSMKIYKIIWFKSQSNQK
jgi:transcriptional regulator with XRE-family HTH domain